MISSINRKLARRRRDRARGPLIALLRSCAGHAMLPYSGMRLEPSVMVGCEMAIGRALRALADRGAFLHFGISSGSEFGNPSISIYVVDDGRPPYGKMTVAVESLLTWVFAGGAAGRGWRDARYLTASDLGR